MKIGFDGKRAIQNFTGLGNYSRFIIEALAEGYPEDSLTLFAPRQHDNPRLEKIRSLRNVSFRYPRKGELKGSLWRTFGITKSLRGSGIDLYHGLSNELPLNIRQSGIPAVVTIHDLIFMRLPYGYSKIDRALYNFKYGRSCRNADRIIAASERTKQDIVEIYGTDPSKIDVVYQGCNEIFLQPVATDREQEVSVRYGLPARYVLQVGTIERRKNLGLTVRALGSLPADLHLVAIGRETEYADCVRRIARQTGVTERVHFLHDIPFGDLPHIYRRAQAIAYPSRYEGFGIPVIEGLASRRPVIAATGSCLEEAGGDAAIYVDPDDPRGIAEALRSVTDGSCDTTGMIGRGLKHIERFRNSDIASHVHYIYEKTLAGKRRQIHG